ncbi:hypothetical protein QJS04_geneDACA011944 [Acorus gramineus]|uniref:Uncharacterized protein n=1 Tax=Acorus gramineus TaxID=55184 RepID=A0AAV9AJC4_ACOGR|nr:hypothetical protein QJS04_geneDACA011944 [Acorus gramineus]
MSPCLGNQGHLLVFNEITCTMDSVVRVAARRSRWNIYLLLAPWLRGLGLVGYCIGVGWLGFFAGGPLGDGEEDAVPWRS